MSQLDQIYESMNDDLELIKSIKTEESEVRGFYADKTLLITGATGFMGKCLVEKLLRDCPDLKHIYVLIREKRNVSIEERLQKFFQHKVFSRLRKINSNFDRKVTAIQGELGSEKLGLSDKDREILEKEVNIIIHNGANVKFGDRISTSLNVNVLGTKRMLDLALECHNLEVFMYVSTIYSHCYKLHIEETFYPAPGDLQMVYNMIDADMNSVDGISDDALNMLIGDYPNIYPFTKAIAEDLVRQYSEKDSMFAFGIFRPSVVINSVKEPLEGWIGNMNGTVPVFLAGGLGALHTAHYVDHPFDCVPCDMTINALLVVTSDLRHQWETKQSTAVVYNYGSSIVNPISHRRIYDDRKNMDKRERSSNAMWMNFIYFTDNFPLFLVLHVLLHFLPACLADVVLLLSGNKPRAVPLFIKATRNLNQIDYFANIHLRTYTSRTSEVINNLNTTDKEMFFCDLSRIDWDVYFFTMWRGLRYYLLKEDLNGNAGERRYALLWYLHYGFISVLLLAFAYFCSRLIIYN